MKRTLPLLLLLSLACAGLPESIIEGATGGGVSVGSEAEFPADFPLPPPPAGAGTILNVTSSPQSVTVIYQLSEGAPDLIAFYQDAMQKKGLAVTRSTTNAAGTSTDSLVAQDGSLVVAVSAAYTQRNLTLVWNKMM